MYVKDEVQPLPSHDRESIPRSPNNSSPKSSPRNMLPPITPKARTKASPAGKKIPGNEYKSDTVLKSGIADCVDIAFSKEKFLEDNVGRKADFDDTRPSSGKQSPVVRSATPLHIDVHDEIDITVDDCKSGLKSDSLQRVAPGEGLDSEDLSNDSEQTLHSGLVDYCFIVGTAVVEHCATISFW